MPPKSIAKTKAKATSVGKSAVLPDSKSTRSQNAAPLRATAELFGGVVRREPCLQEGFVRRRPTGVASMAEAAAADSLPGGDRREPCLQEGFVRRRPAGVASMAEAAAADSLPGGDRPEPRLQERFVRRRPAGVAIMAEAAGADSLPFGWEMATSRSSGKIYYLNRTTGDRTWIQPDQEAHHDLTIQMLINHGEQFVQDAKKAEARGLTEKAVEKYRHGLSKLMDAMSKMEEHRPTTQEFRQRIDGYIAEAEKLKQKLDAQTTRQVQIGRATSRRCSISHSGRSPSPSSSSRLSQAAARPAELIDLVDEERETNADRGKDASVQIGARQVGVGRAEQQVVDGRRGGRLAYSLAEDEAMRRFVAEHPHMPSKGIHIWKDAEKARITRHGWSSMHNRWRRNLGKTAAPARRGQAVASTDGGTTTVSGTRSTPVAASTASGKRKDPDDLQTTLAAPVAAARADRSAHSGVAPHSAASPKPSAALEAFESVAAALEAFESVAREQGDRREVQEVKADGFDGRWFCGTQAYTLRGTSVTFDGEDPSLAGTFLLRHLGPNSCEFFLMDDDFEETLTGCLSDDGQRIWWEDGCVWTRPQSAQQKGHIHGLMHHADITMTKPSLVDTFSRKRARRL